MAAPASCTALPGEGSPGDPKGPADAAPGSGRTAAGRSARTDAGQGDGERAARTGPPAGAVPPADASPPPALLAEAARCLGGGLPAGPWRRLQGGRVNRVWRCDGLVLKQHASDGATALFPNDAAAEAAALQLAAPAGLAPRLRAAGRDWILCDHVEGQTWRRDPRIAADLLARVHAMAPPPGSFAAAPAGSAALRAAAAAMVPAALRSTLPPLPPDPGLDAAPPRLLHGDPVPGNILLPDGGSALLIDWQCPARGDPALDLALFLSPAMQQLYRGAPLSPDERAAFLDACPAATADRYRRLAPLLHWRIAAHCLIRGSAGAADHAAAARLEMAPPAG